MAAVFFALSMVAFVVAADALFRGDMLLLIVALLSWASLLCVSAIIAVNNRMEDYNRGLDMLIKERESDEEEKDNT